MMAFVRGSPVEYDKFYKTARWKRLRKLQLIPLCKFCLERGIVTAANVVDHIEPHGGDWTAFVTASCKVFASRATSRRSGRSSCAAASRF
jgi:5-methylcytosine-specific restriction protein A